MGPERGLESGYCHELRWPNMEPKSRRCKIYDFLARHLQDVTQND